MMGKQVTLFGKVISEDGTIVRVADPNEVIKEAMKDMPLDSGRKIGTLESCFYFHSLYKMCHFFSAVPQECCGMCVNWKTHNKSVISRLRGQGLRMSKPPATWHDLLAMFKKKR